LSAAGGSSSLSASSKPVIYNQYMHYLNPDLDAVGVPPRPNPATNMQSVQMLKLNNLLDPSSTSGSSILQNPMAQFLPTAFGADTRLSASLGGGGKKKK